ncbi:MAG: nitrate reductase [Desulfobacteraceae bacterium]|nr:nitrate reductase [Desulfobacteraceae bacterium]
MHTAYDMLTGPCAWTAFILFFGGCLYRLIKMLWLVWKKERFIFSYMSLRYSLRSLVHWMVPFMAVNWRRQPVLTIATFAFHLCLILTPLFVSAHIILWEEAWQFSWWMLPDGLADAMTMVVIVCAGYFFIRRLVSPEVRYVTGPSDWIILSIVAAPFISGFLAYHQWFAYRFFTMFHIFSGEVMLVAIPFTRLSHMIISPFTRAYMGSEFGKIRHARDW